MSRRAVLAFVLAIVVVVFSTSAAAEPAKAARPARLVLSWNPAPGCIDAAGLTELIEHTLDRPVFGGADARLDGSIVVVGKAFRVHLDVRRIAEGSASLGARDLEIEASDCRALDGSIAVVAALLVDGTPPLPPEAAPPPPPSPPPPPIKLRVTIPETPRRVGAFLGVGGGVTFGLMPSAAVFGSATAWVAPIGPLRVGFEGRVWLPQTVLFGDAGAKISALALAGVGCFRPVRRRIAFAACARFDAGGMTDSPIGLASVGDPVRTLWLVGLDVRFGVTIVGPLYAEVSAELGVPLARPRFYFIDALGASQEVNRMAPVTGSLGLTVGARFGE
ncbi:hypothetical protein BH09MYX1_BH09MYX1_57910 [soil metagenome]